MPSVGRNDPCPCGSGRKYKNCCMRRDQLRRSQELQLGYDDAYVLSQLYRYAQSARFVEDLANAFQVYWGGAFSLDGMSELAPDDVRRFMEWFAHDYRTQADGRPVIELFLEREATQFPDDAKALLQAWTTSLTGMYRIVSRAGESLALYDPLREQELTVRAPALARNAQVGDVLVGRLYEHRGERHFSFAVMVLPGVLEEDMVTFVRNALRLYQEEHPRAELDAFLWQRGYIFQAFLLSSRGVPYRSLVGPGTRFHDPAAARDKLFAHDEREARRRMQEQQQQQGQRPEPRRAPVHRTASGIVLPGVEREEEEEPEGGRPVERPTILIPGRDA